VVINRIRIEKFGRLKNFEIMPKEGLNIVYGNNEAGKSTVAEFIRAMLYGMPSQARASMIRENERVRYMPFENSIMSGSMEVDVVGRKDGRFFTINCRFGKRKSEDKISISNTITGEEIDIDTYTPGEFLTGIKEQAFTKMNYIKQLSTKIIADKDDEILKKLINLAQTGDERTSYQKAGQLLNEALREIEFRGKGKLPELRNRMQLIYSERAEIQKNSMRLSSDERELLELEEKRRVLEEEKIDTTKLDLYKEKYLSWQAERKHTELKNQLEYANAEVKKEELKKARVSEVARQKLSQYVGASFAVLSLLLFWKIVFVVAAVPFICAAVMWFLTNRAIGHIDAELAALDALVEKTMSVNEEEFAKWFKDELGTSVFGEISIAIGKYGDKLRAEQELRMQELINIAETIADMRNHIKNKSFRPIEEIEKDLGEVNKEIARYETNIEDLKATVSVIEEAFRELQMNFGPKLNYSAAKVLIKITNGKYIDIKINESYNIVVVDSEGREINGEYLSSGAYDQIYFALRMGIIDLLAAELPIILDDALVMYDDVRHESVMSYLENRKGQIILFTCHNREQAGYRIEI
jgi:uncharacterized protein YhaN